MRKQRNGMVTQSEESITLNDVLLAFLTTTAEPLHSLRITPYCLIQGSWSRPSEGAAGARSAIEDTRLSY